jgi:hypothetical protein
VHLGQEAPADDGEAVAGALGLLGRLQKGLGDSRRPSSSRRTSLSSSIAPLRASLFSTTMSRLILGLPEATRVRSRKPPAARNMRSSLSRLRATMRFRATARR